MRMRYYYGNRQAFAIRYLSNTIGFLDFPNHPAHGFEHLAGQLLYGFAKIFK